tara:strand:+ start:144 stop:374 length:231 start_codon:yes stop_codon:yes gene_type:complete
VVELVAMEIQILILLQAAVLEVLVVEVVLVLDQLLLDQAEQEILLLLVHLKEIMVETQGLVLDIKKVALVAVELVQ